MEKYYLQPELPFQGVIINENLSHKKNLRSREAEILVIKTLGKKGFTRTRVNKHAKHTTKK